MVFIVGANRSAATALRRELLKKAVLSAHLSFRQLPDAIRERPYVSAVLYLADKPCATAVSAASFLRKQKPTLVQGLLFAGDTQTDAALSAFDFVLPPTLDGSALCFEIIRAAVLRTRCDISKRIVGGLHFSLLDKRFQYLMKNFSVCDTHTALLSYLMQIYPSGASSAELLRLCFYPLGYKARTNVAHAVNAINRMAKERDIPPLIALSSEKGYFLMP